MQYIDVHSYRKQFNNKALNNDVGSKTKIETISNYKFNLSLENLGSEDYVTKKLYEPLIARSVPVYLGAPNVNNFVPGNKCYIDEILFPMSKL